MTTFLNIHLLRYYFTMVNSWKRKDVEKFAGVHRAQYWTIHPEIFRMLGWKFRDKHIGDYGCGEGLLLRELNANGAITYGFDTSLPMVDAARENTEGKSRINLIRSGQIPLPDESLDAIVSSLVFMMCSDKRTIERIHSEAYRVLKAGGDLVYCVTHPAFLTENFSIHRTNLPEDYDYSKEERSYNFFLKDREGKETTSDAFVDHTYKLSTYMNILARAGFKFEEMSEPATQIDNKPPFLLVKATKS